MELTHKETYTLSILGGIVLLALVIGVEMAEAQTYGSGRTMSGTYEASLSGNNEVPSVSAGTTGGASVSFSGSTANYSLDVFNGNDITAAHLHCGASGVNGSIVVTLYHNASSVDVDGAIASGTISDGSIEATAENCSPAIHTVADLHEALENGYIYVNAHSIQYPSGVSRGQLSGNGDSGYDSGDNSSHGYGMSGDSYGASHDHENDDHGKKDGDRKDRDFGNKEDDRKNDDQKDDREESDHEGKRDHKEDHQADRGKDGKDGDDGKDGNDGNHGKNDDSRGGWSRGGSSAWSSVTSFINANSNIRVRVD